MSFAECHSRQVTPPPRVEYLQPHSAGSNYSSSRSAYSYNSSPKSVETNLTTPPRSPHRHNGQVLLPKIRPQDQTLDPVARPTHPQSSRSSLTSTGFPVGYDPDVSLNFRRSASPPEYSNFGGIAGKSDDLNSFGVPVRASSSSAVHSRSTSSSSRVHSRNSSATSNLNESAIRKYICPTHRAVPSYVTSTSSSKAPAAVPHLPLLAPSTHQPSNQPSILPAELSFDSYMEPPSATTLAEYLTAPNPSPALVRYTPSPNRQYDMHYWWDVRNIRTWNDFNVETIYSVPGFKNLLEFPIPGPALPAAPRRNTNPDTTAALHTAYTDYYAPKVNAALKVSLGDKHLTLRSRKSQPGARPQPDFVSNYDSDFELTIYGDGRGRIVGLVRSYNQWNTGMRTDNPNTKIEYLRELALLHRYMREHNCRYGFIMTEIELVCVRAGIETVPNFGFLELSPPVQLKNHGQGQLTAGLALWYLHMLAKNQALPGQCGWKIDVGGPVAQTRHKHLERDQWMLKPEGKEKRDAKRNRGFVWPDEPLNRKECNRPKRFSRA